MGEKENASETGKDEEKQKDKNCESKEKKSLMKKLFGCFSCCVRPQKKQQQEMVTQHHDRSVKNQINIARNEDHLYSNLYLVQNLHDIKTKRLTFNS